MKQVHVLIALQRYEAGGAERQALYLAKGLQERGYKVTVLAFAKAEGLAWIRFKEAGIDAKATGFNERLLLDKPVGLKSRVLNWRYTFYLISYVRRLSVDVIFPFTYPPNVIYGTLWKRMDAKACFWNQRDNGIVFKGMRFEWYALENCTGIISNSLQGKLFLRNYTQSEIVLIHNGVDVVKGDSEKKDGRITVVMVANLHKYKDHLTLIHAWRRVVTRVSSDGVSLLLAGKELNAFSDITEYVDKNNLSDTVTCLGQVGDVAALLARSHIGVFSSLTEGLPNGILECMASGLPVIANRLLGAEELLGRDYPFLFNTGDDEKMAELLIELILDSSLRQKVGIRNFQRAKDKFNKETMLDQYEKLIKSIKPHDEKN